MAPSHENPTQTGAEPASQERRPLIPIRQGLIPACDVPSLEHFERIVKETADLPKIPGYKIGVSLSLRFGLPEVVRRGREYAPDKIFIYDHQKAGNDPKDTAQVFVDAVKDSNVDAAILFPFAGPGTQAELIRICQDLGIVPIVGGEMTQEDFLESRGGYVADSAPMRIYQLGVDKGIRDFVVPGNKVESVQKYRKFFDEQLGEGNFSFYAPGFISQGGDISETGKEAGERFFPIVGRALFNAPDIRQAATDLTANLTA